MAICRRWGGSGPFGGTRREGECWSQANIFLGALDCTTQHTCNRQHTKKPIIVRSNKSERYVYPKEAGQRLRQSELATPAPQDSSPRRCILDNKLDTKLQYRRSISNYSTEGGYIQQ